MSARLVEADLGRKRSFALENRGRSPVDNERHLSRWVVFTLALSNGWPICQLDEKNAFLHGTLEEEDGSTSWFFFFLYKPPPACVQAPKKNGRLSPGTRNSDHSFLVMDLQTLAPTHLFSSLTMKVTILLFMLIIYLTYY